MSQTKLNITVLLLMVFVFSSCKSAQLKSRWKGNTIIEIDGKNNEWKIERFFFEKEGIGVDIMNDDKYLYLCFSSPANKIPEKMLMQGFTIWFDTKEKNKQKLGLRFFGENKKSVDIKNNFMRSQMKRYRQRIDVEILKKKIQNYDDNIEIFTSKEKSKTYSINNIFGTEAKMDIKDKQFIFELKIPYVKNGVFPCSIRTEQGAEIEVKLEIKPRNPKPAKGGSDRKPGGGFSAGGRNGGSRQGGGKQGRNSSSSRDGQPSENSGSKVTKIKFSINLAERADIE